MVRLAAMEMFVRVVDAGSFSAAAKLLGIGQPTVSKNVAQLEAQLGVQLLMRSSRRLQPTEAGREFYERTRRVIDQVDEAECAARGDGAGLAGRLRVSAGAMFASLHIMPRLPGFLAAHPDLSIDLVLDDGAIDPIEGAIDIALRVGPLRDSAFTARRVATGRRLVLAAPAYLERAGTPRTPAELANHAAVIYTQAHGGDRWRFRKGGSEVSVNLRGRLRVSAAEGLRGAVLSGLGFAIVSEWLFARELASGAVRAALTDWSLPAVELWAVFPTAGLPNAKARAFAALLEAELRERPVANRPPATLIAGARGDRDVTPPTIA